uniref:Acireductone synthase n=1 Tax=Herpetomonas muscarum TaxID=5718 RepID=U5KMT9_HERMU|nr:acireductone synthase [Herpetomonas muscarum]
MLQAAQVAYDTQLLLAALSGTLPSNVAESSIDVPTLTGKLSSGMSSNSCLASAMRSKGVPYPFTNNKDGIVTIFLLDMEGTVAPMSYSRKVMFPQLIAHIEDFVESNYPNLAAESQYLKPACARSAELKKAVEEDMADNYTNAALTAKAKQLLSAHMREETEKMSVMPYVKQFQGDAWADWVARQDAKVKTRVFSDFVEFVKERGARGAQDVSRVFMYSTGSIKAQETLLSHTQAGNLLPFVSGLIDCSMVGSKLAPGSYSKIRSHISAVTGLPKDRLRVIFCTDNPSEASAADTSGAVESSILVIRPGNDWVNLDTFMAVAAPHVCSFAQLMGSVRTVDYKGLTDEVKDLLEMP